MRLVADARIIRSAAKFYQMVASVLGRVCTPLLIKGLTAAPPHTNHNWIAKEAFMYRRQPFLDISRLLLPW
jgi:hypothetical protein